MYERWLVKWQDVEVDEISKGLISKKLSSLQNSETIGWKKKKRDTFFGPEKRERTFKAFSVEDYKVT